MTDNEKSNAFTILDVQCASTDMDQLSSQTRPVATEMPLTIEIKDIGTYTIMCTPCDQMALAAGFAFSEGLIDSREDIGVLLKCPDNPCVIRMELINKKRSDTPGRNMVIVSSCGICGSRNIQEIIDSLPVVPSRLKMNTRQLTQLPDRLRELQEFFTQTGGTHAAAIFRDDKLLAACEDLSRHIALDKAIGMCLLEGVATVSAAGALSGRISSEMVIKAARAGIELLAAVSAPTTLAIQAAQKCNITLCGFVRGTKATIYTHPQRVIAS